MVEGRNNDFDYYSKLADIWSSQADTYWTSYNIFLVIEGLILVAVFQAHSIDNSGSRLALVISLFGYIITLAWLLSGNRRLLALRITSQQARYLEVKLFGSELANGKVQDYFPMFFTSNYAIFKKKVDGLKDHENEIREYFKQEKGMINRTRLELWQNQLAGFSESNIMTLVTPMAFLTLWAFLSLWALFNPI